MWTPRRRAPSRCPGASSFRFAGPTPCASARSSSSRPRQRRWYWAVTRSSDRLHLSFIPGAAVLVAPIPYRLRGVRGARVPVRQTLSGPVRLPPVLPPAAAAAGGEGRGRRLVGQLLVAVRGQEREGGGDRGVAPHVFGLQPLIGVHVRVMRHRVVLDGVLNE